MLEFRSMANYRKTRKAIKLPRLIGGKEAFMKFLKENLRYPQEALKARVEGIVIVEFDVDDNGTVDKPRIIKGIGYGCDEEAMRLVSLLRYEKVKNRGIRLKSTTKINIKFKLPHTQIQYNITPEKKQHKPEKESAPQQAPVTYSYTIQLKQ